MHGSRDGLTRGQFIALAGTALPGMALGGRAAAATLVADTVLVGGKVLTVDAHDTVAQAVAIKDGLVLRTGTTAEIQAFAGTTTRVIDLSRKTSVGLPTGR